MVGSANNARGLESLLNLLGDGIRFHRSNCRTSTFTATIVGAWNAGLSKRGDGVWVRLSCLLSTTHLSVFVNK